MLKLQAKPAMTYQLLGGMMEMWWQGFRGEAGGRIGSIDDTHIRDNVTL
jgi:hypothetical protein